MVAICTLIFLMLISSIFSLEFNEVLLVVSPYSSADLLLKLNNFPNYSLDSNQTLTQVLEDLSSLDFNLIIDLTNSSIFETILELTASSFDCPYFSLNTVNQYQTSSLKFHFYLSDTEAASYIVSFIKYLDLENLYLLSSSNFEDLVISNEISNRLNISVTDLQYFTSISQENSDKFIGKNLKAAGAKNILIVDQTSSLITIQNSLYKKKLNSTGACIIIKTKEINFDFIPYSLVLIETGLENSTSLTDFFYQSVLTAYLYFKNFSSKPEILSYLQSNYFSKPFFSTFSVLNPGNPINPVGFLGKNYESNNRIVYPGNITDRNLDLKKVLKLSMANGTDEIYNLYKSDTWSLLYQSSQYAADESNKKNEIPGFQFTLEGTNCGLYLYDPDYYDFCLSQYQDFGIGYLAPWWSGPALGTYQALQRRNITIPQLSPISQEASLDNKAVFPYFLKLTVSISQYITSAFIFQRSLDWKCANVFASNDPSMYTQYMWILEYISLLGIKVVNPPEMRVLPFNYTRNDFEKYRSFFEAAKSNRCRVFITQCFDKGLIWEALYDVGLRKGDVFIVGDSNIIDYLNNNIDPVYLVKRKAIAEYSLGVAYKEWIGEIGQNLLKIMLVYNPDPSYCCFAYDSFFIFKEAIRYLVAKGEDFEDPEKLEFSMRNSRFSGCLGAVFFDPSSNSRSSAKFTVYQTYYNETDQVFKFNTIAFVDLFSSVIIQRASNISWPSGNSTIPSEYRDINLCPFDAYQVMDSVKGKAVLYVICFLVFLCSIFTGWALWKYCTLEVKVIESKREMTMSDMIFMGFFLVQTLQLINYGPQQKSLRDLAENFKLLSLVDFSQIMFQIFSNFWNLFYVTIAVSLFWSSFCFLFIFKCARRCKKNRFFEVVSRLSEYVFPIAGNIGLCPVVSMHLDVFVCNKSIDSSLTSSFLFSDCNTFCYLKFHLVSAVFSFVLLIAFLFSTIVTRPLWELTMPHLNIRTRVSYYCVLSVYQIGIVGLSKTVLIENESYGGLTMSVLTFIMVCFTVVNRPYNYHRITVLQTLSLSLSLWVVLTASIFAHFNNYFLWNIVLASGTGGIVLVGILVFIRFPELIYLPEGLNIADLFLFQFRKNFKISSQVVPIDKENESFPGPSRVTDRSERTEGNIIFTKRNFDDE